MTVRKIRVKADVEKVISDARRVSVFEIYRGFELPVDYSFRAVPKGQVNFEALSVEDWTVAHARDLDRERRLVRFDFMKVMVPHVCWSEVRDLIGMVNCSPLVLAEQEALRQAPAHRFVGVLDFVNGCPMVQKFFPMGASAFSLAGLGTSVTAKKGVKLFPYVQVEKGEDTRWYQMLPAEDDLPVMPMTVIPLIQN